MLSISDDKYVERIRRQFLARWRWGVALLLFGAFFIGGALWAASYFHASALDTLARMDPTKASALSEAADNLAFAFGWKLGATVASIGFGGVTACVQGLYFLLGLRKERLLLQYHDEMQQLRHEKRA